MLSIYEKFIFVLVFILSMYMGFRSFSTMFKVINKGQGKLYFDNMAKRISKSLSAFLLQTTVLTSRPLISIIHSVVAWAFILYMIVNLGDILRGFIPEFHFLGDGMIGRLYRLFVDVFTVMALIGVVILLVRRFIFSSPTLEINENVFLLPSVRKGMKRDSLIVGLFILGHVGFRFLGESFSLAVDGPDAWQPLASSLAFVWQDLNYDLLIYFVHASWWLAIGLILAFIPYFPGSKHAHLFMGPLNYLTQPHRSSPGTLNRIDFEDENAEQFGVSKIVHLEKTQLFDAYACIMCNRCQDVCPATLTGKALSPSALEINKRYFLNAEAKKIVTDEDVDQTFLDFGLTESALWACTSCAACVDICPVGNEPMYDILNIRRDRVLMEAKFPSQLQNAFNGMERNGNPWNMNNDRLAWSREDSSLIVKTVEENPDFDILYWVGCAGAFDQRGQKIARAFTKILNVARVNFSVLGAKESCTGDSARRAGNEYLFAMMAETNVESLNAHKVKKIVTTCPHCLHTLKNEYPQFGGAFEVIHHSQMINQLISEGKLKLDKQTMKKVTFHDPCYLGRHNDIYDEPRADLQSGNTEIIEMERVREHSFCCGAGGGNMWKEEEEGKEAVRRERFSEALETGSDILCTACPFCMTMLSDAGNELSSDLPVRDLAEIIAEEIKS